MRSRPIEFRDKPSLGDGKAFFDRARPTRTPDQRRGGRWGLPGGPFEETPENTWPDGTPRIIRPPRKRQPVKPETEIPPPAPAEGEKKQE